jgi:hypothetical protein
MVSHSYAGRYFGMSGMAVWWAQRGVPGRVCGKHAACSGGALGGGVGFGMARDVELGGRRVAGAVDSGSVARGVWAKCTTAGRRLVPCTHIPAARTTIQLAFTHSVPAPSAGVGSSAVRRRS